MERRSKTLYRQGKKESGFSLLEVLLATVIFGMMSSAFAYAFGQMSHQHSHQRVRNQALDIASSLAEEVMSWTPADVRLTGTYYLYYDEMGRDSATPQKFTARWVPEPDQPLPGLTTVNVFVEWDDQGVDRKVKLRLVR